MKILVTGAAGFIGFHVSQALLAAGHEVLGLDNFNAYYDVRLKEARWALLEQHEAFSGLRADIGDSAALRQCFGSFEPERVCHLAAQAGVRYSLSHPEAYVHSNLAGFVNIAEQCRHHGLPRLVYASSSSVYGGNTVLPFAETDPVETPVSLYAATKRAGELMAHTYSHLYGLQTIGLRFFTVYGPWGRPDMAMWLFTRAILGGEPIRVFNHGDMQRDFTYIDDIVAGVIAALFVAELPRQTVINLGNHRSEQLVYLIELIEQATGKQAERRLEPLQPGDVKASFAAVDRARELLAWEPTTSLAAGVPRFVEWFMSRQDLTLPV